MAHRHVLDFVRIDVEAGDVDHVLLAIDHVHVAAFVDPRDVAGPQETVGGHHLFGLVRPVPVARHHLRALDAQFAGFADLEVAAVVVANGDLRRGHRQADRAVVAIDVERIGDRRGRGLGQSVGFDQRLAGHRLPALGDRSLHRHAAADRQMQVREIELGEVLVVQERVEQRVDARDGGEACSPQRLHERRNVARIGDQKIGGADHQRHEAVHLQREHVIERQCGDEDFAIRPDCGREPRVNLAQICHHIAVGQHRSLRHAGGPAGVLKERNIIRLNRRIGERLR